MATKGVKGLSIVQIPFFPNEGISFRLRGFMSSGVHLCLSTLFSVLLHDIILAGKPTEK